MHKLRQSSNRKNVLKVYNTPARDLTVIKGVSGVVYPFYKSSGVNSKSDGTWFPWMGYFEPDPRGGADPVYANTINMAKPNTVSISGKLQDIIKEYLKEKAPLFIKRMGNDEALALSCCLGGGVWDTYPKLRVEISWEISTGRYIKELRIGPQFDEKPQPLSKKDGEKLVDFKGIKYSGKVLRSQAEMAHLMEEITANEISELIYTYSIQQEGYFPLTSMLPEISSQGSKLKTTEDLTTYGMFKGDPPPMPRGKEEEGDPPSMSRGKEEEGDEDIGDKEETDERREFSKK
ncbi:hypothetical protein ACQUW5_10870 [Legionella sp. CNM-1927-20]|uniref:hypothetical protein n=1 Tax=Legionella sp. CNM-1927-20 TaxID=3422221 RepID=UPI00403B122D